MLSALVLSALLLLLRCPACETLLSEGKTASIKPTSNASTTEKQTTASSATSKAVTSLAVKEITATTPNTLSQTSLSAQPSTILAASDSKTPSSGSPALLSNDLKDSTTTSTTVSTKPGTTSIQSGTKHSTASPGTHSGHSVTTNTVTSEKGNQAASEPRNLTSGITVVHPSLTTPASPHQPATVPGTTVPTTVAGSSEPTQHSPKGPNESTAATGFSTMMTTVGPTFTTPSLTPTPGIPTTPSAVSPGTPHTPAETPAVTSTSEPLQPTGTSLGSRTTSPVRRPTSSIAQWASTAPQDSSIPSPTFSVIQADVGQIRCYSPEKLNEKMLILNVSKTDISKTDICNAVASNDKLVTLLCRAAKASFNPAHDECHVQLAPFPGTQEVAVKQISILTNLLPTDVYEFLKDKRDELKEMGVSDMQFHGQGPPEEPEDRFSMPLIITIVCMASFLLLVAALYGCCHQRLSQRKDQQRLTEELQTVENGYHDNPTLEVMETSSEMQEKKVVSLNGELGDSWIVPLDNLTKDDLDEEEDTHL